MQGGEKGRRVGGIEIGSGKKNARIDDSIVEKRVGTENKQVEKENKKDSLSLDSEKEG